MAFDGDPIALPAPVFLVGPARSGTTLLYKALCLHPDVAYISNWVRRFPGLPILAHLNAIPRRAEGLRRQTWFHGDANAYVYGVRRSLAQRVFPMPVEGETIFRRCGIAQLPSEASEARDRQKAALRRALGSIRSHDGAPVFLNKRIANNRRIPLLLDCFPDARFVLVVRDGRAVAYSLSRVDWWPHERLFWESGTPQELESAGRDPWELCATNWCRELDAIEQGLALVPPDQILRTTYEDFVAEPIDVLHEVAGFMGLSPSPTWVDSLESLRFPNRNAGWSDAMTPEAISTIERVEAVHLARYRYA